jgi:hypothetical protein
MSTASYDYTREDTYEENPDDFILGGAVAARSADEIEKENVFLPVPPGDHLLVLSGFAGPPQNALYTVTLNGQRVQYEASSIRVRFSLPSNPRCSVVDFFLLPPNDPRDQKAYFDGLPEGKKQAGWAASKFIHFINRLGYTWLPGQPLPEGARRLGNWKGRMIHAVVEAGKGTYKDRDGIEQARGNQIKAFTYRPSQDTVEGRGPGNSGGGNGSPMNGGQPQGSRSSGSGSPQTSAQTPAHAPANSGLDNI